MPEHNHPTPGGWGRGRGAGWQRLRRDIMRRDNHTCVECGAVERLEVDHIVSLANGGTDAPDNLRTVCRRCHLAKTQIEATAAKKARAARARYNPGTHPGLRPTTP